MWLKRPVGPADPDHGKGAVAARSRQAEEAGGAQRNGADLMSWEEKFMLLAARARTEEVPQVNVVPEVLTLLSSGQAEPLTVAENLGMWLAAGASAVAVPAAGVALSVYNASMGPLREIVNSISWAM